MKKSKKDAILKHPYYYGIIQYTLAHDDLSLVGTVSIINQYITACNTEVSNGANTEYWHEDAKHVIGKSLAECM